MADSENPVQVVRSSGLATVTDTASARKMADELVTGAISSLRKPITIPTTGGVDLTDLGDAIDNASEERDATREVIDTETGRYGKAIKSQQESIRAEGGATAESILANQATIQETANLYKYFGKMFGVSDDPNADIAKTAAEVARLRPGAEAKLRKVQEMQAVGPLDNPMNWLVNQLQMPAAVEDYNRDADYINGLQGSIDGAIKTAQDAANFAGRGIPTISARKANADAAIAKFAAEKTAALAEENLSKQNVAFATTKLAGDINIANLKATMTQEEVKNEQLRYTSLINEINLADTHANRQLKAAQLLETLEKTKGLDILLAQYDKTTGHPVGTTTRYTFEKFPEAIRQNMVAIGAGSLGTDPFIATVNWKMSRPGPMASRETVRLFDWMSDKIEVISATQAVQQSDEKQKPAIISRKLREEIELEMKSSPGKTGSLFYELEPATMLVSGQIAAGSKLAAILEPLAKETGPVPTEKILATIAEQYPNPVEAGAVIAEYYQKNIRLRNMNMNTDLAGIKVPVSYQMKTNVLAGSRFTVDLTQPADATKWVLANNMSKQVRAAYPPTGRIN